MYAEFFHLVPAALLIVVALFGLLVGSFLNVVAYRLPIMMEREWRRHCEELDSEPSSEPPGHQTPAHERVATPVPGGRARSCR